ncbi:hypothetical protein QWY20_04895 [Alkalimonas sp. MEB108]|uniref:Uncharacterized protein n=1 Tax=Alkalimonas cellulosilytica TaxID=3058395 RepID=A0ABU7J2R1_9GAMM|nr:hypothetical protein [Alkalimonas sp. MEB108]MEE2000781.1 hypothetical protein [Alkalimonas sp. MEB108]
MDTLYLIVGLSCAFSILSFLIAWPVVGWFVVRPIQKQLRANKEDVTSDWVIFLYKPWVYAWAIFYPIGRFNNGTSHFYSNPDRMKAYASKTQWWLCAWMIVSIISTLLITFLGLGPISMLRN